MIAGKSLQAWLDRADELGAEGKFFEAHEELELAWKDAHGPEKRLLQGLIQIAAGLHRWKLQPEKTDGAFYLLERGFQKLEECRALLTDDSRNDLKRRIEEARIEGTAPQNLSFELRVRVTE